MIYEVVFYDNGMQVEAEFNTKKEAIKFAIKVKGIVLLDKQVIEDFSK